MNQIEKENLIEEIKDVKGKMEDILETLKNNKELDSTQEAFLLMHLI